ncbi:E3 SUMO-protein ligase ZNF451-like isoform X2 [Apus apus]|uniref:E3 SUMO-protein ligase ZNF451-like isoform X2 n=1 Tax=Apus apus TaxID=8895 RepID=UPI0021F8FBF4|nr:E3 SUMO-protein ligase ZNF451-like isoform X2 [Apus apus]
MEGRSRETLPREEGAMESRSSVSSQESKSSVSESEDDIEFVGEGPLRPVVECIDLVSSEDEEPSSSSYVHRDTKRKDHVDYQKERVASTLARLARHVEVEKRQKEEKNKAFKEKVDSQYAQALQELEFIRQHTDTEDARSCVRQWLKMPDLEPGTINSGKRRICKRAGQARVNRSPISCPVMHCDKEFDNAALLLGHLQRTRCHNSGPVAVSKKSISQVAEIFKVEGYCENCDKLFADKNQVIQHNQTTQHKIKFLTTVEESILMFCHINGKNKNQSPLCHIVDRSRPLLKRHLNVNESVSERESTPSKQKRDLKDKNEDHVANQSQSQASAFKVKAWFCECLQKFFTEESVEKHILSANRICHKCAVCGKLAENSSIISLHMSRFHGGAHLNNFFFWCRACSVDILREEDIMGHVTKFHGGHSYYYEQEALEDEPMPSASNAACISADERKDCIPSPMEVCPEKSSILGKWQCRICEEMFDSEESVKQHCMSLESHAFHRYCCGLCRNHFRKIGTLQRHCQEHHNKEIQTKYFCGLCGNLFFDTEEEFLTHYKEVHSMDYAFVPEQMEVSIKKEEDFLPVEKGDFLTCGCRATYVSKINRRNDYVNCQKAMLQKGNLWFRCCVCSATAQNFADLNGHLNSHTSVKRKGEMYVVRCAACNKNFDDLQSAHQHYHMKHCCLQKPNLSSLASESENTVFKFTANGACVDRKPHKLKFQASPSKTQGRLHSSTLQGPIKVKKERKENSAHSEESGEDNDLPDLDYLSTMTHIVLVDLDNWGSLFTQLPANLNQGTFIWGFQGGYSTWKPPVQCKIYNSLKRIGCFFLHPRCGTRREAADFAICVHAGRLDEHLPKQIPFTVLSGDKSFLELENQFKMTQRSVRILNPHHMDGDMMCALLNSISDAAKGSDSEEDEDLKLTVKKSLEETKKQEEQDAELEEAIKRSLEEM